LKVLVLEPNVGPRAVIARAFYLRGHEVISFSDLATALAEWQIDEYPVVVVGWKDDGSTVEFCRQIRNAPGGADAFVLVVGGDVPLERLPLLAAWVDDVVPPDPGQLAARIAIAERRAADAQQRRAAQEQFTYQALHDALTDLPNRALLTDRLAQSLRVALRQPHPIALLVVDLDRFKEVNDSYGHHVGDLVLRAVGERMQAVLRASDTVARLGGDEFAVLLPSIGETENAVTIAAKIFQAICEPVEADGNAVTVGASVGVAIYPTHGTDVDTLLVRADAAMYSAKRAGGGVALCDTEAPDAAAILFDAGPGESGDPSAPGARADRGAVHSALNRRSHAELLRTVGQALDQRGARPGTIICEDNGFRVRERGRDDGPERWFPVEELVRESMSRAQRRKHR
jgi:diguanylate cyclase (GGDEF)-like protein